MGAPTLRAITSAEYPLLAARPINAATSKDKIKRVYGVEMADWETQLGLFLRDLTATTRPQATKV